MMILYLYIQHHTGESTHKISQYILNVWDESERERKGVREARKSNKKNKTDGDKMVHEIDR